MYNSYIRHFEFDPAKDTSNRQKHGIGLSDAIRLWDGPHVVMWAKMIRKEKRFLIVGRLGSKTYVAVFTLRKGRIRLISVHRADKKLERFYEEKKKQEDDFSKGI
jgi:uncharacterized DUF497 family protein